MNARTCTFSRHRAAAPTITLPAPDSPQPTARRRIIGRVFAALGAVLTHHPVRYQRSHLS